MSARAKYTVAAVAAVAVLGATAGYVYLNQTQTETSEPFTAEVTDDAETGATELAEIGTDLEAAAAETAPTLELEAVPATGAETVVETGLDPVSEGETLSVDAATPDAETVLPAQPE